MFSAANNFLNSTKNEYLTDLKKLTCTCPDWQEKRSQYATDDPRRLCKHIVKKLDLNALPKAIKYFRESIAYYQSDNKGFNDFDFDKIIHLPQNDLKILGYENIFHAIWMNVYDKEGNKYGLLIDQYTFAFVWAKENKPIGFEEVEEYFSQPSMKLPLRLQEYEKNELIFYMKAIIPGKKDSSFKIEEDQYIPIPSHIYYSAGEDNNSRNIIDNEIRWIVVKNDVMIIEMYNGKEYSIARDCEKVKFSIEKTEQEEQERLNKEREKYEQKLSEKKAKAEQKGYLFHIKDSLYREAITKSNRDHDAQYTEYLDATEKISLEYMSTQQLLKSSKIDLTLLQFNNIVKNMEFITKVNGLNLDDWIVVNDGLKFGINLEKSSHYFSETIPDWYQIKRMHPITFQLLDLEDRQNVRMTNIFWKNDKFSELLQLVIQHIENSSNARKIVMSSKQTERDAWLQFVECPNCFSKNIHKKNKRTYGYGEVQRYQCMDCKKIFQELINKKPNDDVREYG